MELRDRNANLNEKRFTITECNVFLLQGKNEFLFDRMGKILGEKEDEKDWEYCIRIIIHSINRL